MNRGAGYGLEIPCIYKLYGPKLYVDRILQIITSLQELDSTEVQTLGICVIEVAIETTCNSKI